MVRPRNSSSSSSSGNGGGRSCYRGHWRPAEDEKLRQLVEQFGPQNWNFVAEHFQGRSGKSCRLRWYNQLDPNINKNPFTEEEEERLLIYQQLHGNKWALIARHFKGRTDNAVKNHYHVIMARRRRERFTIFGNKSLHQNPAVRNPKTFVLPKLRNPVTKWPAAPPGFGRPASWEYGGSSRSSTAAMLNRTAAILNGKKNAFRVLSFGDGNGGRKMMKMGSSGGRMNSGENGPMSERKETLPFIDFLGMGSS